MAALALHFTLILFSLLQTSTARRPPTTPEGGFTVSLIHRDSINSPFYNSSSTLHERIRSATRRSVARANHLSDYRISASAAADGGRAFVSQVYPTNAEYLMTLSVGTPPFNILAIADTGSDLIWTQCKPCQNCYKQNNPLFDPATSSSFHELSCHSTFCTQLPMSSCGAGSACEYQYGYGDGSNTVGALVTETVTFNDVLVDGVALGCTHESEGTFDSRGSGLVGLGGGPLSLISQLGSRIHNKFSYCLVPYSRNTSSALNFGKRARITGATASVTPLVPGSPETFYYLSLEQIIVNAKSIPVGSSGGEQSTGKIIIDSGTTLSFLPEDALSSLTAALTDIVKLPTVQDPEDTFSLCFHVNGGDPTSLLPAITLRFSGNADMKLQPWNAFLHTADDVICLAFLAADRTRGIPILGNIAQQNFEIVYDLGSRTLSFAAADCSRH